MNTFLKDAALCFLALPLLFLALVAGALGAEWIGLPVEEELFGVIAMGLTLFLLYRLAESRPSGFAGIAGGVALWVLIGLMIAFFLQEPLWDLVHWLDAYFAPPHGP